MLCIPVFVDAVITRVAGTAPLALRGFFNAWGLVALIGLLLCIALGGAYAVGLLWRGRRIEGLRIQLASLIVAIVGIALILARGIL